MELIGAPLPDNAPPNALLALDNPILLEPNTPQVLWQPDYLTEWNKRIKQLKWIEANAGKCNALMTFYKTHPIEFIEDCCVTFDPRRTGAKRIPFVLFPKQREYVRYLQALVNDKENGLTEKARDMGATWLCCCFALHQWIFVAGTTIGFGSRKAELVDHIGDTDSIIEKIRMLIRNLPYWLRPIGFVMKYHGTYMKIQNPENGSLIKGECGDNIGRGGRTTMYFKDESAHYEHPELIEAALGDNTDVQIDISSVHGTANVFYRRRMAGEVWSPGITPKPGKTRVFIFDWRSHPLKTQAWYDKRRTRAEEEGLLHIFAQEVDRDYAGSIDRVIIDPKWVRAAIDAHKKLAHLGNWFAGENILGADVADEGNDKNAQTAIKGSVIVDCDHQGGDPEKCAEKAVAMATRHGIYKIFYDRIGVGSGFKVAINNMKKMPDWNPRMKVFPWGGSDVVQDPLKPCIPNEPGSTAQEKTATNEEQYENLKAQSWTRLATRFLKTYNAITKGHVYPVTEMISIDSTIEKHSILEQELSQAIHAYSKSGKMLVDKKPEGALSPNIADSAVIGSNPIRKSKGFFDVAA